MGEIIQLDFTNAPAVAGGGGSQDHITPGQHHFMVVSAKKSATRQGKTMVTTGFEVNEESEDNGSRLDDRFTQPAPGDSQFPLQRFHALLLACGIQVGNTKVKLDLDKLIGLEFNATVKDEKQDARDVTMDDGSTRHFGARTISRIDSYLFEEENEAPVAAPAPAASPAARRTAPTSTPAPITEDLSEDEVESLLS